MLKIDIASLYGGDIFRFIKNAKGFSRVAVGFQIPTSNILVIQFFHTLARSWYYHYFFILVIFIEMW